MANIREGRWLCRSCGAENRGRNESCSGLSGHDGCGVARPTEVRFYLPENSPIVTDVAELADADSGADWHCDHCGGANKNAYANKRVTQCVHCGAGRDGGDIDTATLSYAEGAAPRTAVQANPPRPSRRQTEVIVPLTTTGSYQYILATAVGLLAVVGLVWYFFFIAYTIDARVTDFSWTRSVTIERYQTVREDDWDIPVGGREVDATTKIRSYRQVFDHNETRTRQVSEQVASGSESYSCGTTDLGNGYFRDNTCSRTTYQTEYHTETYSEPVYRDEPVYDTWYTYDIERWLVNRTPLASGKNHTPVWPDYTLANNHERVSSKPEQYMVYLIDVKKRQYIHELPLAEWSKLGMNQVMSLTRNRVGSILDLKPR